MGGREYDQFHTVDVGRFVSSLCGRFGGQEWHGPGIRRKPLRLVPLEVCFVLLLAALADRMGVR